MSGQDALRVLLVSDFVPPVRGGLEFHVDALAGELAARGHDVHVATLTPNPAPRIDGVVVHPVHSLSRYLPHESPQRPFHPPLPEPQSRLELGRLVRELRPDVVHVHSWLGVSVPHGVPSVFTAHDYGLVCALRTLVTTGGRSCAGPALRRCVPCAAKSLGAPAAALMVPGTTLGRRLLRPDAILAVSESVAGALRPYCRTPVEVVPNFVGVEPDPVELPDDLPDGEFVLYAGDPGDHKGVPDLLAVWDGPARPSVPLVLAVTRPLARAVPDGVITTSLSRAQVASAWRRATLAVVPSRWADPCPTVALEAQRAGRPIVGTATGGLRDIVRDGVDGYLVPPGDVTALGERIAEVLADDALRARFAVAAAEHAHGFTAAAIVPEIVAVYRRVSGR